MRTALLLFTLAAAPALAQDAAATPRREAAPQPAEKKKKVIRLDAITVEGRVLKPQAFYILQRSQLDFDSLSHPESFVPKVVKSVEKEPF